MNTKTTTLIIGGAIVAAGVLFFIGRRAGSASPALNPMRNDAGFPRLPAMPAMPQMPQMPGMPGAMFRQPAGYSGAAPNAPVQSSAPFGPRAPDGIFGGLWGTIH